MDILKKYSVMQFIILYHAYICLQFSSDIFNHYSDFMSPDNYQTLLSLRCLSFLIHDNCRRYPCRINHRGEIRLRIRSVQDAERHVAEDARRAFKFPVGSSLDDASLVHDDDFIAVAQRAQAVRD